MTKLDVCRRQAILGVGAALMMSGAKQAAATDGDFAARLADLVRRVECYRLEYSDLDDVLARLTALTAH